MHGVRRIGGVLTACALGVSLLLASSTAGAVSTAQLKAKTLALSDLPAGWAVDNAPSGSVSNLGGCLNGLATLKRTPRKGIVRARVRYKEGAFPALQETIEAGKGALGRYRKYLGVVDSCKTISFSAEGIHFTGSVGALSFPTVGDSSHAFSITIGAQGQSLVLDLLLFRVGQYDGELLYGSLTQDTPTLESFATEALDKIEGKSVGPSTTV